MKKEDMKKLSYAEKQDSQQENVYSNKTDFAYLNFLLLFFLINDNITPQIPINGFCKLSYFKVDSGFTRMIMVNYNEDAYSDLLLYNPSLNEIALVKGMTGGEFNNSKKFFIPYSFNSVQSLNYKSSTRFVYTSRKNRSAGIFQLNKNGKPEIQTNVSFDSYPEFINTADVNSDNKNDLLISGGAFKGMSILLRNENDLTEEKISDESIYSHSIFIELNNDEFPDIAAYDLINRSFIFFYNNSLGSFRKARTINLNEKPISVKSFDINLDSYDDLIFSDLNSINIWYGDFRSSYEKRLVIKTKYKPDKFIYGDFNRDGFIDIAYLNTENSLVSIIFAKDENDYYGEIIYLHQKNINDIIPYYSRFINGIAALSFNGELYTITHVSSFTDDVNISLSAKPFALSYFDYENNSITDFCFIDSLDNKIKFILRDITGRPSRYYSFQLIENHEKIITENLSVNEKIFICYSFNKKMIEIVNADFDSIHFSKQILYVPGEITDLKVKRDNVNNYSIFILYRKDEALHFGKFTYRDFKFDFSSQIISKDKTADASIGLSGNTIINYWSDEDSAYIFNLSEAKTKKIRELYFINKDEAEEIVSFTGDLLNIDKNISINFLNKQQSGYALVFSDVLLTKISGSKPFGFRITNKNHLFFGETRLGLKKLFAYQEDKKIISRLEFIQNGRNVILTKIADVNKPGDFFIKNMTSKNYHLVYSNLEKNCISIIRLRN